MNTLQQDWEEYRKKCTGNVESKREMKELYAAFLGGAFSRLSALKDALSAGNTEAAVVALHELMDDGNVMLKQKCEELNSGTLSGSE